MDDFLIEREHPEPPPSPKDHRHPTERDRDRILHSSAFRRLQGKTQVFGIGQADFYRTRLTHSIEASQLARAIANNLLAEQPLLARCLAPELAEAVALAHDLGHPPFGHAGEKSLDACMRDVSRRGRSRGQGALRFEGNAQTFHVLVAAEPKSPSYPGLNLTRATLAGVMKYPYAQDTGNEKFIFPSDADTARWALRKAGGLLNAQQVEKGKKPQTSIACQIMDWADDCAYSIHDIEDALQAQFLRPGDLTDARFAERVAQYYEETRESESVPPLTRSEIRTRLRALKKRIRPPESGDERAYIKQALRNILNELIIVVSIKPRPGAQRSDYAWTLIVPDEARILSALCKGVIWEAVITDPRVAVMTTKGKEILHDLFYLLLGEVEKKSYALFPRYFRPTIEEAMGKGQLEAARGVCNFLALLRGSKASSVFDFL
jgi:dGTPase